MDQDYVLLKIDTERHRHGAELAQRLRGDRTGGIPWLVITDSNGQELVTSDRPNDGKKSNIGCPVTPDEQAWFLHMLDETRQHMTQDHRTVLAKELAEFAQSQAR